MVRRTGRYLDSAHRRGFDAPAKRGMPSCHGFLRFEVRDLCVLFVFILLGIAVPLKADVTDRLDFTYYVANADPSRSLLDILNASSPIRENGIIYHADTNWNVRWDVRWFENPDGSCRITSVSTELTGNIRLPRLFGATDLQMDQFNNYLSALSVHESGHYDIGRETASAIDKKILSLPAMPNCKDLATAANSIGYQTLEEQKKKEKQYEASTDHGRLQGAWLDR
jgi:predicted secreted Zn-dependent protease